MLASDTEQPQHKRYKMRVGTKTRQYSFAGKPVCKRALQLILGVGNSTLANLRDGNRSRRPGSRTEPKHPELGFSTLQKAWVMHGHCKK